MLIDRYISYLKLCMVSIFTLSFLLIIHFFEKNHIDNMIEEMLIDCFQIQIPIWSDIKSISIILLSLLGSCFLTILFTPISIIISYSYLNMSISSYMILVNFVPYILLILYIQIYKEL